MISFIIPYYNASKTLSRCLDSILQIKNIEYEIILVDDGSTDETESIVKKYSLDNKNIKLISITHSGVSKSRNVGIISSRGDYICFVDSDDTIDYKFFENNIDIINVGYDLIVTNMSINAKVESVNFEGKTCVEEFVKSYYPLYRDRMIHLLHGKIIKRKKLLEDNILFRTNVSIGEDLIFNLDLLMNIDSVFSINDTFYNYAVSENSVTLKYNDKAIGDSLRMFFSLRRIYKSFNLNEKYLNNIKVKMTYSIIVNSLRRNLSNGQYNQMKIIKSCILNSKFLKNCEHFKGLSCKFLCFMLFVTPNIVFYLFMKAIFYLKSIQR